MGVGEAEGRQKIKGNPPNGKNTFVITEKGSLFLEEYQKFSDFAGTFGLEL